MDNLVDQLRRLRDKSGAAFVMSDIPGCGVGALDHVYHPLAKDHADEFRLAPFTVIVDPERLRMIMPEKADEWVRIAPDAGGFSVLDVTGGYTIAR